MPQTTTRPTPAEAAPELDTPGRGGLRLHALRRSFGAVRAVDDVTLDVPAGRFVSFLGPSGCGKTTLLRLIAGLDRPNGGSVVLDDVNITDRPAPERDVGMVFQSLALFPHLDVRRNIGYGLRIRSTPRHEVTQRVEELLELVQLPGLGDRKVTKLSGGQRQRVAIARALARHPALFLLDEPMSALDANLRESLQVELRLLQQRLGITTIMVTHDQREAMTMSDVIVVLNEGRVEQVGPPLEVYRRPRTTFVARFMGTTNLLRGTAIDHHVVSIAGVPFDLGAERYRIPPGADVTLSVRPGDAELQVTAAADVTEPNSLHGTVTFVRDLGGTTECFVDCGLDEPVVVLGAARHIEGVHRGDPVRVRFAAETCTVVTD